MNTKKPILASVFSLLILLFCYSAYVGYAIHNCGNFYSPLNQVSGVEKLQDLSRFQTTFPHYVEYRLKNGIHQWDYSAHFVPLSLSRLQYDGELIHHAPMYKLPIDRHSKNIFLYAWGGMKGLVQQKPRTVRIRKVHQPALELGEDYVVAYQHQSRTELSFQVQYEMVLASAEGSARAQFQKAFTTLHQIWLSGKSNTRKNKAEVKNGEVEYSLHFDNPLSLEERLLVISAISGNVFDHSKVKMMLAGTHADKVEPTDTLTIRVTNSKEVGFSIFPLLPWEKKRRGALPIHGLTVSEFLKHFHEPS